MDVKTEHSLSITPENATSQPTTGPKAGTTQDRQDMIRMGKAQEFRRNFSSIPIAAFALVLMSTWESVFTTASYVIPNGGPAGIIWTYLFSVLCFGAAILSMAEMASMAPTSGGQYHWVSEFAPPGAQKILSYVVGWFCVLGWQAGVAGQSFGCGLQIQGLIILNDPTYIPKAWHATLLTIAIVSAGCIFNTFFARRLPLIEAAMAVVHLVGFFAVMITLWVVSPKAPSDEVWTPLRNNGGWPTTGLAFMVGITSGVSSLIGPDAAVHMSEEVRDASRAVPWVMVSTLIVNGVSGFVAAVTLAYCLGPLDVALDPPYGFAFISTFYHATQSRAGATALSCVIIFMTFCSAITNVATGSRQMFAFARDNGLPFSRFLSLVYYDIPLPSILTVFTIASLLSLINLGSSVAFNAILSIGIVSLLTSYMVSISCILHRRLTHYAHLHPRRWDLGAWGLPLNIIGLAFVFVAWVFAFFPLMTPVALTEMNWACVVYGGVAVGATGFYCGWARDRYVAPVVRVRKEL